MNAECGVRNGELVFGLICVYLCLSVVQFWILYHEFRTS